MECIHPLPLRVIGSDPAFPAQFLLAFGLKRSTLVLFPTTQLAPSHHKYFVSAVSVVVCQILDYSAKPFIIHAHGTCSKC
jgi:hypothetical protein